MTISAKQEQSADKNNYTRHEFSYQNSNRHYRLPEVADNESIEAKHKDGTLLTNIPKKKKAQPEKRKINIA